MYAHDRASGHLEHLTTVRSPRGPEVNDGPRHVKIHPNGKILYCVTEHSKFFNNQSLEHTIFICNIANLVDSYEILPTSLAHIASRSLIPLSQPEVQSSSKYFRGDTLLLPPSTPTPKVLIATTRGSSTALRGWLSIFPLDEGGNFVDIPQSGDIDERFDGDDEAHRFQTPTSGGKANAIDILPKSLSENGLWILLTDDDDATASPAGVGAVRVLEWDGWTGGGVKLVSEWPSPDASDKERVQGASHAIWLD
jgi:carboxy-cis,cis-muconate cyclase